MIESRTGTVLVAADVKRPWKNDPAKFNRVLTVVDQETGRTEELDVHYAVNGELDGMVRQFVVLRLGTTKKWPRTKREGVPNVPYTETVVLGGFLVDATPVEPAKAAKAA